MAKLVSLFWWFSVVYDAIECMICCSCEVNVVVVSVECFLVFCAWLQNVGGVCVVLQLAVLCRVIPVLRIV